MPRFVILLLIAVLLAACGSAEMPDGVATATPSAMPSVATPSATPTETPVPPSATPTPTATPTATDLPPPTCTPVACEDGELRCPADDPAGCPGGCGFVCVPPESDAAGESILPPITLPPPPPPGTPTLPGNVTTEIKDVWYCEHLEGNGYRWYTVEITSVNGIPTNERILSGPYYGDWQPNCPGWVIPLPEERDGGYPLPDTGGSECPPWGCDEED